MCKQKFFWNVNQLKKWEGTKEKKKKIVRLKLNLKLKTDLNK
jgi:hypothetical protein